MARFSGLAFAASLAVLGAGGAAYWTLAQFNAFAPVERKSAGSCAPVTGISGASDLQIDPGAHRVFIAAGGRARPNAPNGKARRGLIYAFNVDDPLDGGDWADRTRGRPAAFSPRGLYFYRDDTTTRLFVVNAAANAVELYDVSPQGRLKHVETISERRLTSPEDVVAVGPRAFYVTNNADSRRESLLGRVYFVLRAGAGNVLFFDGQSWRVAAEGLRFAGGVTADAAGDEVYVAESAAGAVRRYRRDVTTNSLTPDGEVTIGAAPENLNMDRAGALWIAAQPKPLSLLGIVGGRPPSLVLRYDPAARGQEADHVYADDGKELSASSAAAGMDKTLVIGGLSDRKFLICKLQE